MGGIFIESLSVAAFGHIEFCPDGYMLEIWELLWCLANFIQAQVNTLNRSM